MKLFFKIVLCFLFFLIFKTSYAKEYKQAYLIEVGGLDIGKLQWSVILNNEDYKISISLKNKGFVSNLYKFSGNYETKGVIKNGFLFPTQYTQDWKTKKKKSYIEIDFAEKKLVRLLIKPAEVEFPRIEYMGLEFYSDPLTSFLKILLEDKIAKTIDGRRTYTMFADRSDNSNNKKKIKIFIKEYTNIWTDHKRNDLKKIEFLQNKNNQKFEMPSNIFISFKQFKFKLTRI